MITERAYLYRLRTGVKAVGENPDQVKAIQINLPLSESLESIAKIKIDRKFPVINGIAYRLASEPQSELTLACDRHFLLILEHGVTSLPPQEFKRLYERVP